jgi:cytochrome oxidase assembly protein ShyY1
VTSPVPARRPFWAVALQPRMLGVLVVVLLAVALCVRLGVWQLDRAYERADLVGQQEQADAAAGRPAGLGELVAPQTAFGGELVGRTVWVEGAYDPEGQMLVTGRALDGRTGYLVLTPLRVSDDGTGGASWAGLSGAPVVPVVRGWVADQHDAPGLAVPEGTVRVTGWLQAGEATSGAAQPANPDGPPLTDAISTAALVNTWGGPIWDGYVVLTGSQPEQVAAADGGPAALPRPVIEGSGSVNMQSLFYAVEWWVFGLFALGLWVRLALDEAAAQAPDRTGRVRPRRGADAGIAGLPG